MDTAAPTLGPLGTPTQKIISEVSTTKCRHHHLDRAVSVFSFPFTPIAQIGELQLGETAWRQASLRTAIGGLGLRSTALHASGYVAAVSSSTAACARFAVCARPLAPLGAV